MPQPVRVLVCDHVELEYLSLGPGFKLDNRPGIGREELLRIVGDYEVLVVRSRTKLDREVLGRAGSLKAVARPGTGLDNIDVEYAESRGVKVFNSPESLVEAVAEHVTLLMLALSRKLTQADQSTKAGRWEKDALMGRELKGKFLGIVGLGRIGRRIASIARVLGMAVLAYDVVPIPREVVDELQLKVVSLDQVFSSSDYVTLHVPLTPETMRMVGSKRLATMRRTAYLINTSRGGVIDEAALADALKVGVIRGAALDVFEKEPPSGQILSAPNLILTPHIGGQTEEAQVNAISVVGEKLNAFFAK
ncbi:MAG: D-2-hydroxyacid dehydrogenase [Nitrososphaerota archaeon]|nr:D-2-hydroxyacid dehydrogenase [Nitrososphaerota archaeon]